MAGVPSVAGTRVLRLIFLALFALGAITFFFMFFKTRPSLECRPLPTILNQHRENSTYVKHPYTGRPKPLLLLWFWPEDLEFDFGDCKKHFDIDSCILTDDRALYLQADDVIIFHNAIKANLSNLPSVPRPKVQRWIWMNMEPPATTHIVKGIDNLFNLSLTFRHDADIRVHVDLNHRKPPDETFEIPEKKNLVCYATSGRDVENGTGGDYYKRLSQHIGVDVYDRAAHSSSARRDLFSFISGCKFYLAFEDVIHRDYITDKLNGPLAVGTVPVVLGPPRQNYEDFVPGDSFIHVDDFPDAKALAGALSGLGVDNEAYLRYFGWRKHFYANRQAAAQNHKYLKPICKACDFVHRNKDYRVIHNLHSWYSG